jgi:O-antigen/teichoic acid export membrane protein
VVIACRFPIGLYQGALNGLQLNTVTSAVAVAMTTFASGGAVLLLAFVSPRIEAFFTWQAFAGIVSALTLRGLAWRAMKTEDGPRFDAEELRKIWHFAVSMAAIALSAIVFTQLDKLILSNILSLGDFGCYMLATVISGGLYLLTAPLFNVIYPRFSLLVATGNEAEIRQLYRIGTRLFATVLFPVAFVVVAFAHEIVAIWTGDAALAEKVAPLLSMLSVGTALHGVMFFPYALQLAYGIPRLALKINLLLLVLLAPLTIVLASRLGALGGAMAWLILQSAYVPLGCWLTHRKLLTDVGAQWLILDVTKPLVVAGTTVIAARALIDLIKPDDVLALVLAAGVVMAAITVGLATSPQACKLVAKRLRARRTVAS